MTWTAAAAEDDDDDAGGRCGSEEVTTCRSGGAGSLLPSGCLPERAGGGAGRRRAGATSKAEGGVVVVGTLPADARPGRGTPRGEVVVRGMGWWVASPPSSCPATECSLEEGEEGMERRCVSREAAVFGWLTEEEARDFFCRAVERAEEWREEMVAERVVGLMACRTASAASSSGTPNRTSRWTAINSDTVNGRSAEEEEESAGGGGGGGAAFSWHGAFDEGAREACGYEGEEEDGGWSDNTAAGGEASYRASLEWVTP